MSIPIVSWAMMAFRAPLAQAMLIAGAMALLAIDVAMGRAAPAWGALPAAFVALYAVQRIGGKILLGRLQRAAESWTPIDPGLATVAVTNEGFTAMKARHLLTHCDVARIASIPGAPPKGLSTARMTMAHWLSPAGVDALRLAAGSTAPPGWALPKDDEDTIVVRPLDVVPPDCLLLTAEPYRAPLGMVTGTLQKVRIQGAGIDRQVLWGAAQIAGRIPLFTFFHWTAIVGRSAWHVGFAHDKAVRLGPEGNDYQPPDGRVCRTARRWRPERRRIAS